MIVDWARSSFCADKSCVEVALLDRDVVGVRDGKNASQPHLRVSARDWESFLDGVVAGDFDFH